jgi:transposase
MWTANRVVHLIEQECGVSYHPGHVWKILRQLGWSCQRPAGRALERDERTEMTADDGRFGFGRAPDYRWEDRTRLDLDR